MLCLDPKPVQLGFCLIDVPALFLGHGSRDATWVQVSIFLSRVACIALETTHP